MGRGDTLKYGIRTGLAVAIGLAGTAAGAMAQDAPAGDIPAVVKAIMQDQYGDDFDAKNACWAFTHDDGQDGPTKYCMRAEKPDVVDTPAGKVLYLRAINVATAGDGYNAPQPGLMGAFRVRLGGRQGWTYTGLDNAMEYGSAGECGCSKAALVKLSDAGDYGWLFATGLSSQGVTASRYSLVASVKGDMKDISRVPQVREGAQDTAYEVSVKPVAGKGFYPLHVVKSRAKATVDAFDIPFDAAKSVYALPAGR